jgi:hypothetical protein
MSMTEAPAAVGTSEAPAVAPDGDVAELAQDQRVNDLLADVEQKLKAWSSEYEAQFRQIEQQQRQARIAAQAQPTERAGDGHVEPAEIAEPFTTFFGIPYLWFDLLAVGPFQPVAPGGPFRPHRILRAGEPAVLIAAIWRNPVPLPGGPNPSAAQIMTGMPYQVRGQTVNVNDVLNGPDLGPQAGVFGAGFVNVHFLPIPTVPPPSPPPAQGAPRLLEIYLTIDVTIPVPGLPPFAGYASRWFQPDTQPPFMFPFIPNVGPVVVPGLGPGLVNESPVRVLIYN